MLIERGGFISEHLILLLIRIERKESFTKEIERKLGLKRIGNSIREGRYGDKYRVREGESSCSRKEKT